MESIVALLVMFALFEAFSRRSKAGELRSKIAELESEIELLRDRVSALTERDRPQQPRSAAGPLTASHPVETPSMVSAKPVPEPVQETVVASLASAPNSIEVGSSPEQVVSPLADSASDAAPALPIVADVFYTETPTPPVYKVASKTSAAASSTPSPVPPGAVAEPESPFAFLRKFDWESLVGVRLFSIIAFVALVVALVSFLRYSVEQGWLGPPIRMAAGIVIGIVLLVVCETKWAQKYRITAHAMTAAGLVGLFLTFLASHALWDLIGSLLTFALLVVVTALAVLLSVRRNSLLIALLGLLGGFSTPILVSTGKDNPFGLFGFLLVLNLGISWVAYKKRWPILVALSLAFTGIYQVGWTAKFFDATRMPLGMGIFILFPIVSFAALVLSRRNGHSPDEPPLFAQSASLAPVAPILFAVYLSATPECGAHFGLLFGFVAVLALGLAIVAALIGPEWLHAAGAGTALLVTAVFMGRAYTSDAWPWMMPLAAMLMFVFLGAPLLVRRLGRPFVAEGMLGVYAAPLLLFVFPVLAGVERETANSLLFFGPLFLLAALLAGWAIAFENGPLHFLASAFILVAEAVWSGMHLDAEHLLSALLVYSGFGLFYLGIPFLAERIGRPLRPQGSGSIILLASIGLLFFLAAGSVAQVSLWVLALLLGILNVGLLFEASRGRRPILALAGILLSWVVVAVWWMSAIAVSLLVPALVVTAGFALLATGGGEWIRWQAEKRGYERAPALVGNGVYLGLAGHLFLLAVAAKPDLASQHWPWLSVLAVLDLAIGIAALATRRGVLHLTAEVLTSLVLLVWVVANVDVSPAPPILVFGASTVLGLFALGWYFLALRRGAPPTLFYFAGGAGLFLAQFLVVVTETMYSKNGVAIEPHAGLVAALVVLLLGVLVLSWRTGQQGWTLGASLSFGIAVTVWVVDHPHEWSRLLALALPLYLMLLMNPLVLRDRARSDRLSFAASLVASAFFFFFGRLIFIEAGISGAIGLLPIAQAFLLIPHIWLLLHMQAPSERDLARLALMAGALLAFITVAIPLQLEKQWITLGFALQSAALAWLYRRIPHKGLLWWLTALFGTVLVRLSLNPAVLAYYPRSEVPIFNWYLYTYLVSAGSFFVAAWVLGPADDRLFPGAPRLSRLFPAAGTLLLFLLVNIEIADFYSNGSTIAFEFSAGLAPDLTYTIAWALFAIGLLVAGVLLESRAARVTSILLLTITVLKAFLHDLAHLKDLFRVASFVGLAISLVLVAVVLQRFVLHVPEKEKRR